MANQFPAGYMPRYGLSSRPVTQILPQQPMMPSVRQMPVASMPAGSAIAQLALRRPTMPSGGPLRQPPAPTFPGLAQRAAQAATQRLAAATPAPQPAAPQRRRGFLEADFMSPRGQALAAASETGLQLSGYQDRPITLGQGLGAMAQAARQAYTATRKEEQAAELAKQTLGTDIALKLLEMQGKEAGKQRETSKVKTDREMKRSEQFRTASQKFGEARLNYGRIVANATTPNPTGATDIALIFNFMKMLDPISVVRGSEYKAAEDASPLLLRLGQQYNKLFKKEAEKLPAVTRRAFLQTATETFVPYVEKQQRLEKDFIDEAIRFGLDPKNIVRTMVPETGTKQYPHLLYEIGEAENLPEGSWVMFQGELLQVSR